VRPLLDRDDRDADFDAEDFEVDDRDFDDGDFAEDDDAVREPRFLAASRLASRAAIRSVTSACSPGSSPTTISSPAAFFFRKSSTWTRYVSS
jgi:hypothetical protein